MKHPNPSVFLVALALLTGAASFAQPSSPSPAPAAPKPPTVVQGTTQLAGDVGVIGKTFTLGKGDEAINFTLNKAVFTVTRVTVGDQVYAPTADQKLLVLSYTVHNPQKTDKHYTWNTLRFTVVDALDVNHEHDNYVGREGTSDNLDITLKPGQKINAFAVMAVPARGPIPKLIVSVSEAAPVVRYDLRGKVEALPAPAADPADRSGVTARQETPMPSGTYAPLRLFDLKLESVAFSSAAMGGRTPEEGRRFLVATFSIRNGTGRTAGPAEWSTGTFTVRLKDSDGEEQTYEDYLVKATRDEHATGSLRPGEEAKFRVYFELPKDVTGKSLIVQEGESRSVVFDVSKAK